MEDAQDMKVMDLQEIDLTDFTSEEKYVPKKVKISGDDGLITEKRIEIKKLTKGDEDKVMADFNNRQIESGADGQMTNFSMSLGEIEGMRKKLVAATMIKYNIGDDGVDKMSSELYSQVLRLSLGVNPIDMLKLPEETPVGGKAAAPASTEDALKKG